MGVCRHFQSSDNRSSATWLSHDTTRSTPAQTQPTSRSVNIIRSPVDTSLRETTRRDLDLVNARIGDVREQSKSDRDLAAISDIPLRFAERSQPQTASKRRQRSLFVACYHSHELPPSRAQDVSLSVAKTLH